MDQLLNVNPKGLHKEDRHLSMPVFFFEIINLRLRPSSYGFCLDQLEFQHP